MYSPPSLNKCSFQDSQLTTNFISFISTQDHLEGNQLQTLYHFIHKYFRMHLQTHLQKSTSILIIWLMFKLFNINPIKWIYNVFINVVWIGIQTEFVHLQLDDISLKCLLTFCRCSHSYFFKSILSISFTHNKIHAFSWILANVDTHVNTTTIMIQNSALKQTSLGWQKCSENDQNYYTVP